MKEFGELPGWARTSIKAIFLLAFAVTVTPLVAEVAIDLIIFVLQQKIGLAAGIAAFVAGGMWYYWSRKSGLLVPDKWWNKHQAPFRQKAGMHRNFLISIHVSLARSVSQLDAILDYFAIPGARATGSSTLAPLVKVENLHCDFDLFAHARIVPSTSLIANLVPELKTTRPTSVPVEYAGSNIKL